MLADLEAMDGFQSVHVDQGEDTVALAYNHDLSPYLGCVIVTRHYLCPLLESEFGLLLEQKPSLGDFLLQVREESFVLSNWNVRIGLIPSLQAFLHLELLELQHFLHAFRPFLSPFPYQQSPILGHSEDPGIVFVEEGFDNLLLVAAEGEGEVALELMQ